MSRIWSRASRPTSSLIFFCAKRLRKIYDIGEENVKAKRSTYLPWGQDQPGTTLSDEESKQIKEEVLELSKDVNMLEQSKAAH